MLVGGFFSAFAISFISSFFTFPFFGCLGLKVEFFNIQRNVAAMGGLGRRELLTAENSGTFLVHSKAIFEIMRLHHPSQNKIERENQGPDTA